MGISALISVRDQYTMNLHCKILSFIRHEAIDLEHLIKIGLIKNSLLSTKKGKFEVIAFQSLLYNRCLGSMLTMVKVV